MNIGNWVKRDRKGTRWHLIDSTVAGGAFTQCGRRMLVWANGANLKTVSHLGFVDSLLEEKCKVCREKR